MATDTKFDVYCPACDQRLGMLLLRGRAALEGLIAIRALAERLSDVHAGGAATEVELVVDHYQQWTVDSRWFRRHEGHDLLVVQMRCVNEYSGEYQVERGARL